MLATSIRSLHRFLADLPFAAHIVIADNASTDATPLVARGLALELAHVTVIHLKEKGRGRALRAAWSASAAEVVCYMDVDLSTDLNALESLLAPLLAGHSDVATGSRLMFGSHVQRHPRGTRRLDRGPRLARAHHPNCVDRPARDCAARSGRHIGPPADA